MIYKLPFLRNNVTVTFFYFFYFLFSGANGLLYLKLSDDQLLKKKLQPIFFFCQNPSEGITQRQVQHNQKWLKINCFHRQHFTLILPDILFSNISICLLLRKTLLQPNFKASTHVSFVHNTICMIHCVETFVRIRNHL